MAALDLIIRTATGRLALPSIGLRPPADAGQSPLMPYIGHNPARQSRCYTSSMRASRFARIPGCLSFAALLLGVGKAATSADSATGHFETYCDGVGFFLAKIDGAPAPRKLVLFLYTGFPGIPYVPKEEWKAVKVYRDGCAADGKCQALTNGRVRLQSEITPDGRRVSGKYEIQLGGQNLQGEFAAERRLYKHPPRLCM